MEFNVGQNILLNGPAKEVEFCNRCQKRRMIRNLKIDSLAATERIKEFLTVGLQLAFVVPVDQKLLAIEDIISRMSLGIIGNKPINYSKADFRRSLKHSNNLSDVVNRCIEPL